MRAEDVIKELGSPPIVDQGTFVYRWSQTETAISGGLRARKKIGSAATTDDSEISIVTLIRIGLLNSKVVSISVYHSETT